MEWLKWSGLVVQVLGFGLACWGMWETYRDHWRGRRKLISDSVRAQLRTIAGWFALAPPRRLENDATDTVGISDSATFVVTAAATGHGQASADVYVSGDLDGLVRVLAERVDKLSRTVGNLDQRLTDEESARQRVGAELTAAIEAGDKAQEELTHESAGGGLRQELIGAALILFGIVLQGIEAATAP